MQNFWFKSIEKTILSSWPEAFSLLNSCFRLLVVGTYLWPMWYQCRNICTFGFLTTSQAKIEDKFNISNKQNAAFETWNLSSGIKVTVTSRQKAFVQNPPQNAPWASSWLHLQGFLWSSVSMRKAAYSWHYFACMHMCVCVCVFLTRLIPSVLSENAVCSPVITRKDRYYRKECSTATQTQHYILYLWKLQGDAQIRFYVKSIHSFPPLKS